MAANDNVITVSTTSTDPVSIGFWLASQVQAGVWAVFLCAILVVFFTRKRVTKALDSHFALMESMKEAIQTNASNQTRNADSQAQLAKVLEEMEVSDSITRKDVEEIKRTQYEILEYVSGVPRRSIRSAMPRQYLEEPIDELP